MMHMLKSTGRVGAFMMLLPLCAGCALPGKIESSKEVGYAKHPHNILAYLPSGFTTMTSNGPVIPGAGEAQMGDGFDEVFLPFAAQCKITAHTNLEQKVDGKSQQIGALIAADNPDWIVTIEPTKAQTVQMSMHGVPMGIPEVKGVTYNVTVIDRMDNKKVWRANVSVPVGHNWLTGDDDKQPGRNVATWVITQMQADGLLTECPVLAK